MRKAGASLVVQRGGFRAGPSAAARARGRAVLMVTSAHCHQGLVGESALEGAFDTQDDERKVLHLLSWYLAARYAFPWTL